MVVLGFILMAFLNWVFLAFFICSALSLETSGQSCDPNDLLALKEFAGNLTGGTIITAWSNESICCQWDGVVCGNKSNSSASSRVTSLILPKRGLEGKISISLARLDQLKWLDLSCNHLADALPLEFSNLKQLEFLDLSYNLLSGPVSKSVSGLISIQWLNLSSNLFNGELSELGRFPNVAVFNLSNNSFTGRVSSQICSYSKRIQVLDLSMNHLVGSLEGLDNCSISLQQLHLDYNSLSGYLPDSLYSMSSLEQLSILGNNFSGNLTKKLSKLSNLKFLIISGNHLSGRLPDVFGNLAQLELLCAHSNLFSGPLPSSLSLCSKLRVLDLRNNSFSGPLDLNFTGMPNLFSLDLATNHFAGPLPASLSDCKELQVLSLAKNEFSGRIPESFANLRSLVFLSLSNNSFIDLPGTLSVLQQCKNLSTLILTSDFVLNPIFLALDSNYAKVAEPALESIFKLFSLGVIHGEIDSSISNSILYKIVESVCRVGGIGEELVELAVLRVLLSAVRCPCVLIRGDCLLHVIRTCYNIYLGSLNGTNQICAKSVLAQIMLIVFTRAEEDSMDVSIKAVPVNELLEFTDKNLNEGSSIYYCQNFVSEVMSASEGIPDLKLSQPSTHQELQNGESKGFNGEKDEVGEEETKEGMESSSSGVNSKIREDGFLVFKNLCKLSMKFSSQENPDDQILLRGKTVSLELLKVIMHNGGSIWRTNERFLNAIKQYLCLSLLKNSALSVMSIFQLQCSIFMSLLTKFRSGLKAEIGIFFPMLILRVLENVLQPSFVQKMTVLNLLEKIVGDSQIIIDIFVNYDCDVDSPNIFERIVNGLLKTALGPPPGSTTTLSAVQDITFRHESVKCLVGIIKSMGTWMDEQLKIGDSDLPKSFESDTSTEYHSTLTAEDGTLLDSELHPEMNSELSDAVTLEQRRAYKIELQKGVSLFNRKPSKGIEFLINTKKVGNSPEEVASFLKKNTTGLNETMIGDYLGEREEFSLRVMHAYVDSFNFKSMDFGEAIRFFLRGFRLPGEAQKIDRIMEKFAERYCKCNPNSFTSADTAYVLAYSVIMLNTDAHNNMVKDKMTKSDFIRNNRGIDDGKDLPEEYLGALYDQIVKNEIKMNADSSVPQSKQANSLNKLLGLDGILNLVSWKQTEEKPLGANGLLIRHIQEQFKAKSGKSESVYHAVSDIAILRFMVEVCWGPMLAAFSVTLDQSDDRLATTQCLQGFRHAVHVTAVLGMQTQRDAFVTSVAKFTFLHCAADMKQKNVDAVKAIISIAIEDGNHLQEAWEHILTCLSRIEHLQLLGEGAPTDASFLSVSNTETDEKTAKSAGLQSLKKKGTLQNPAVMAVVRGGSYDSTTVGVNSSGLVSPEQINHFIANLNLLDQIGHFELNHVFAHSQRLNSEAIVAFVKALCKVSMSELHSPTDPRVFSLTKLVEIAHYNMNRIRLVWSRMWNVLSDFFVSVGLSENLSVAIFVMDSLRQLAMKFLEREELANYNFQNEFLRPFVIVMRKSNSAEIRELIVRCISQMVLSRVSNVKSGWKSVFVVFTLAAADEHKNIVLLAFETMEKIVREYFPHITETEAATFTDCVRCLIKFTNSRFNSDVSLNAIAFLRFCAFKLAEGGLVCTDKSSDDGSSVSVVNKDDSDVQSFTDIDDPGSYWVPLLIGLSKLTSDSRLAIRKSSLEVLFNILNDHGHLFSRAFWFGVFSSAVLPIFNGVCEKRDMAVKDEQDSPTSESPRADGSTWDTETSAVAAQCLVDLYISFYNVLRPQLLNVIHILTGYLRSSIQGPASTGVAAMFRLTGELGGRLSEDEWREIFQALKEAATSTLPGFMKLLRTMDDIKVPDNSQSNANIETSSDHGLTSDDLEDDNLQTVAYVVSRMKSHISVQLLIIQVITDMYKKHLQFLSAANINIIVEIFSSISSHALQLNSESTLQKKIKKACSILELADPPMLHFENETYQNYLNFLQDLVKNNPSISKEMNLEALLVAVCEKILQIYLNRTDVQQKSVDKTHWILPLGSARREELAARTPLLLSALKALNGLERDSFRKYIANLFHLLIDLVRGEHSSGEVQQVLSNIFQSSIGSIVMQ